MGKKNRRNRAKKIKNAAGATTTAEVIRSAVSAVLDSIFLENEAAVSSATTVGNSGGDTRSCYHGSNKEAFRNDQYRKAGREYVENMMPQQSNVDFCEAFRRKHAQLMIDEEFSKYLFAVCGRAYLLHGFSDNGGVQSRVMRLLLRLAIGVRYLFVPLGEGKDVSSCIVCHEKFGKYHRDIMTVRGVVNVLARETRGCGCFKDAKKAAKTTEKVGRCHGCWEEFPKETLLKCPCGIPQYCTRECQLKHWYWHKDNCIAKRMSKSKTKTANGGDADGDGRAGTAAKKKGTSKKDHS